MVLAVVVVVVVLVLAASVAVVVVVMVLAVVVVVVPPPALPRKNLSERPHCNDQNTQGHMTTIGVNMAYRQVPTQERSITPST